MHQSHENPTNTQTPRQQPFTASDLPIDEHGRVYHLQITPEQLSPDVIIVGDPGRAQVIGNEFFNDLEVEHEHRGLVTITGTSTLSGQPTTLITPTKTTVTTSGMGTPSLEIVLQELQALNEIDFNTRLRKEHAPALRIIRVGTSGGLQASTALGTPIISSYAIGMDNSGLFYEAPFSDEHSERLESELADVLTRATPEGYRFRGKIHPYVSQVHPKVVQALQEAASNLGIDVKVGLTVSNSGFFAPQGRDVSRLKPTIPDIDHVFAEWDPHVDGQRVENMEMESSFLSHFLGGLGYWSGAICPAIANRRDDTIDHNYQEAVRNSTNIALLALSQLRKQYP